MRRSNLLIFILSTWAIATSACSPGESTETPDTVEEVAQEVGDSEPVEGDYLPAEQVADIPLERVDFEPASRTTIVEDAITGYGSIDYVVKVDAGQPMSVSMDSPNTAAYFNLIEPGETDVAIHVGSTSGNSYSGISRKSGDYRVRVYMMRSAARREETAPYKLEITVGGT